MRTKRNILFLVNCSFESHITQIYPNISYILLQKNLVAQTPATSSLLFPFERSSTSIEKHNIHMGQVETFMPKNCLSGFCFQKSKHRSNQHLWLLHPTARHLILLCIGCASCWCLGWGNKGFVSTLRNSQKVS